MKPGAARLLRLDDGVLRRPGPDALERLYAAHPGWDAPRSRVALYGRFVRHHVRGPRWRSSTR